MLNMRLVRARASGRHQPVARRSGRGSRPTTSGTLGALVRRPAAARAGARRGCRCSVRPPDDVAHPTIRNRGTTVGSIVHADPAGEMPAVLLLCDGEVEGVSATGARSIAAADASSSGPLESALRPGELATGAVFPAPPGPPAAPGSRCPAGPATMPCAGSGLMVTLDPDLRIRSAPGGPTSRSARRTLLVDLTEAVAGAPADAADWAAAGALARAGSPDADIHATARYRHHLVGVLAARAGPGCGLAH